jgi:hypothetical protein
MNIKYKRIQIKVKIESNLDRNLVEEQTHVLGDVEAAGLPATDAATLIAEKPRMSTFCAVMLMYEPVIVAASVRVRLSRVSNGAVTYEKHELGVVTNR